MWLYLRHTTDSNIRAILKRHAHFAYFFYLTMSKEQESKMDSSEQLVRYNMLKSICYLGLFFLKVKISN